MADLTYVAWQLLRALLPGQRNTDGSLKYHDTTYRPTFDYHPNAQHARYRFTLHSSHRDTTLHALAAAKLLIKLGFVECLGDGRYRITDAGIAAASDVAPARPAPPPPPLTERDYETLSETYHAKYPDRFWEPLDCGASSGSHHAESLYKLARHGLVETKQRGSSADKAKTGDDAYRHPSLWKRGKGSRNYRITAEGLTQLSAWRERRRIARAAKTPTPADS